MKSQDSIPYYEHHAAYFQAHWLKEKNAADLIPFMKELKPESRILDLGCGSGMDLNWISKAGHRCVGIDASSKMVEMARALNPGAEILLKNFLFLNLKENEFDAIWANHALDLLPSEQTQRVIASCFKGLAPGGLFGLIVSEGEGTVEDRDPDLNGPSRTLYLYREKSLCSMLEQTGFHLVRIGRKSNQLLLLAQRVK